MLPVKLTIPSGCLAGIKMALKLACWFLASWTLEIIGSFVVAIWDHVSFVYFFFKAPFFCLMV